jgi:sec-independent protein translocase protein TatC
MKLPKRLQHGEEATLVEHLGELRARIVLSLVALIACFGVAYAFHGDIVRILTEPLPEERERLVTLSPAEPFITSITVSLFAALIGAMPIIFWQAWSFLAPAFQRNTQRQIIGLVIFAAVLAGGGLVFGYLVALPKALQFLTTFDDHLYDLQLRAREYYSFAVTVLLSVVVVFEVPIFILGLVRIGILTPLKLRKGRRVGYVIMCALAVALPGVDPVTTILEMIPLMLLFEGSIWLSYLLDKRWRPERYGATVATDTS